MLEMRSDRAVLFNYSGQIERSIEELQALLAESRGRADLPDGFHIRILETLAMNYVSQRRPQDAAPLYEEVLERRAATRDDNQRFYAIALANSAASLSPIGDFRKARQRIEEAVSIYDGIFGDTATHYRAFARLAASQNLMRMGDLPAALQQATLGGEEWARYRGSTPAEDPQHHLYRGRVLASWGRWPEAIEAMRAAIDGYESSGQPLVHFIASAESTLARGLCLGSMAEDGNAVLASLDARVDSGFDPDPVLAAEALEAKAICSFASGQADAAIAHLQALSPMDDAFPAGEAAVVARRRSVRALVLEETGRPGANAARMDAARILDDLGIPDQHPWRDSPRWEPHGEVRG
jgi:tetratricopeptide (TPR) repeat protein